MQEQFEVEEYESNGFGTLYVTPMAKRVIENFYGDVVKNAGNRVSELFINLRNIPEFDSAVNGSEKEFYIGMVNPQGAKNLFDILTYLKGIRAEDVSMDEEVAERFEKDHGSLRNHNSAFDVARMMESDPFFEIKYNGERMELSFAAPYHQRQDVRHIESILQKEH